MRRLRRLFIGGALVTVTGLLPLQTFAGHTSASAEDATYDACGVVTTKSDGSPWACSFVDDFNGTTLDTTKWIVQETQKTGFRTDQTCYTASDKNVRVGDGLLTLTARDEGAKFNCQNAFGDFWTRYTGGMIGTKGKFGQAFGRFEVRAKLPSTRVSGIHGGFWMLPVVRRYGAWPLSGEIDVAEWWSVDPSLVMPSLHYMIRDSKADSGWNCRITDLEAFHTYTLDWQATGLTFSIDGSVCFTRLPSSDGTLVAPAPFDQPFGMILNMAVGKLSGVNKVTAATPFPADYLVDYVKAWR
ncbi:glycoside hydrolase family 16 protein [Nocardioides humilatus]|uniref:glycoside hydrolase family 16 protein n=1 Tax=Nocardioides humilatus TaxID=2607660 RepID=UPI00165F0380|nr:glycoside hydrolase family 16 protein [Nocardioides humilatus]